MQVTEVASFRPVDPDVLVRASLACPRCLHDVEWELTGGPDDHTAVCECPACGDRRDLGLTPEQALRLDLGGDLTSDGTPPPGLWPL